MKRELSLNKDDSLYCKNNNSSDVWNQKTKAGVLKVFV